MVKIAFFDENKEDTNFLPNLTHLNTIKLEKKNLPQFDVFGHRWGPAKGSKRGYIKKNIISEYFRPASTYFSPKISNFEKKKLGAICLNSAVNLIFGLRGGRHAGRPWEGSFVLICPMEMS